MLHAVPTSDAADSEEGMEGGEVDIMEGVAEVHTEGEAVTRDEAGMAVASGGTGAGTQPRWWTAWAGIRLPLRRSRETASTAKALRQRPWMLVSQ